ncbi:thiamine phosphate synthase [bacterium]|nr:thiamine phosphate synthase [bacterium]
MQRCRLYLITPPVIPDAGAFEASLVDALSGGDVACLQIRLKDRDDQSASDDHIIKVAKRLLPVAQDKGVAVLINDRPDLARDLGADGVHIGQSDASYRDARRMVGDAGIVGVTCHASKHLALEAGEAGADYVAFGAFFPTETKQATTRAELDLLTWWQEMVVLPCVAIGGITVENAPSLVAAGADFLAVSSGVWGHKEGPGAAVAAFNRLFEARSSEG